MVMESGLSEFPTVSGPERPNMAGR